MTRVVDFVGGLRRRTATVRAQNCPNLRLPTTMRQVRASAPALLAGLLAALLILVAAPGGARAGWRDAVPPDGRLDYRITREGSVVGKQSVDVRHDGDGFLVRTQITIDVTFLSLTIYRFEHDAVETWTHGRLTGFVSRTDDDGKDRVVELKAEGGRLKGSYNGKPVDLPGDIIPASLWHPATIGASVLLDPIRGRSRDVAVADLGPETVTVNGGEVEAHHYSLTGQIAREVWYDADGRLLKVQFSAKDGSEIEVELK